MTWTHLSYLLEDDIHIHSHSPYELQDSELALLKANFNMVMERTMDNTVSLSKITSQMDNMTSLFTQILEKKKSKANDIPNMDHVVAHSTSDNSGNTSMPWNCCAWMCNPSNCKVGDSNIKKHMRILLEWERLPNLVWIVYRQRMRFLYASRHLLTQWVLYDCTSMLRVLGGLQLWVWSVKLGLWILDLEHDKSPWSSMFEWDEYLCRHLDLESMTKSLS